LLSGRRATGDALFPRPHSHAPIDIAQSVGRASQQTDAATDHLEFESLSARQFREKNLVARIAGALKENCLDAKNISSWK
jgi:hypothetical protein